ncbi:MAG: GNAT family N-acetyltransferase [Silicimonas sp.]|nr:GNAT family N-acetyltransferase [Silicimonas sp.]
MTFEISDLSDATLEATAALWHTGWHEAHAAITPVALTRLRTHDDFRRRLRQADFPVRLALKGDEVLGFVAVIDAQLYQIFVAKAAQGRGVAKALMNEALTLIRDSGAQTAWLSCAVKNHRASAFYEKTGWHNVGENVVSVDTSDGPFDLNVLRFERTL